MSTITWPGKGSRKHKFTLYDIGTDFRAIGACYIFTKESTSGKWTAIYVGQTSDLSERFDNHHAMPCIKKNGATHICVYTEGMRDAVERRKLERELIDRLDPPCNKKG
ncbi:MAG: GIY-YIG nuclease family protein [Chloroflexi bacterium]|nr:GIY-YIG nuclease family protein [Chloroflexota bacterium]